MRRRIYVNMAILAIATILTLSTALCLAFYNGYSKEARNELKRFAATYENASTEEAIGELGAKRSDRIRVTLIAANGAVDYDSAIDATKLENHIDRQEVKEALINGVGESKRFSDSLKEETYYYAIKLKDGSILRTAITTNSFLGAFFYALPVVICAALAMIICVYFWAGNLAKKIVEPINKIDINSNLAAPYKEFIPFVETIVKQRERIERELSEKTRLMDMRREFSANVSHELKTPLTSIYGYAEMLCNDMVKRGDKREFFGKIKDEAARLIALIEDIIMISELDEGKRSEAFVEIDLKELASETAKTLELKRAENNVSIDIEGAGVILANRSMIFEALYNLIDNAIKYNKPNGNVKIAIEQTQNQRKIIVSDTGIGIPEAAQNRVFERFYRVDKSRSKKTGGTGLGLAIVKHIVLFHNASIDLKSKENVGSVVTIAF
ncbi:MAG: ATP-binding protein [Helicobacteraceae bacterium]|nr:ATP-binding protein [Helicobacteraceae bacterium]